MFIEKCKESKVKFDKFEIEVQNIYAKYCALNNLKIIILSKQQNKVQ